MASPDDLPTIPQALIDHLRRVYPPITNTIPYSMRELDHRSGQISVADYLEVLRKKQSNGD
jgi:hypothetical protein